MEAASEAQPERGGRSIRLSVKACPWPSGPTTASVQLSVIFAITLHPQAIVRANSHKAADIAGRIGDHGDELCALTLMRLQEKCGDELYHPDCRPPVFGDPRGFRLGAHAALRNHPAST